MHANVEFAQKVALAYGAVCKPLCRELGLTQTAFDILLFLANNPSYRTARDIVEVRHIKANLVSVNVDKLVQEGYLTRQPVAGDRRKTALACTPRAQEVIRRGRQLQTAFFDSLFRGMELILENRASQDASIIAQRICGVCPVSHANAASIATENAFGIKPPEGGRMVRTCWGGTWGGHSNPDYRMVVGIF